MTHMLPEQGETTTAEAAMDPVPPEKAKDIQARTPMRLAWERFRKDRVAMGALVVIVLLILMAILAKPIVDLLGLPDPNIQDFENRVSPDGLPGGPGSGAPFGSDNLGRDILARVIFGSRVSIFVGIVATGLSLVIGVTIGLFAGYFGGWIDTVLSRLMDVILSFPQILFAIALVTIFEPGQRIVIFVIAFFGWVYMARIVRGQVLSLREKEFIEAARSLGASDVRIIFVDVLPNLVAPIIIYATLIIPQNILTEASLSFLGLGVEPPRATWGNMLNESISYYSAAWWFFTFPGLALLTTVLAFNLLGDGLRDALDPRAERTMAK